MGMGNQWYTRHGYKLKRVATAEELRVHLVGSCDECNGQKKFKRDEIVYLVDDGSWTTGVYLCEKHFKLSGIKEGVN